MNGKDNESFLKLLPDLVRNTLAEPGCISYAPCTKNGADEKNK